MQQRPIKVLMAKTSLDSHWRGPMVVTRALRDAGMEVIWGGMLNAFEIASTAIAEDVDVIGLNIGGRYKVVSDLINIIKEGKFEDVLLVAGGTIPQGTLVDIETTGLDTSRDEIVVFGYIQGSRLEIICRTSKKEEPFIAEISKLVPKLSQPFYAYNLSFEKEFLKAKGMNIKGIDLFKPWKEKADELHLKWPKLDELFSHAEHYFSEPVISGKDVPMLWEAFLQTGDKDYLQQIVRHNESDLLRELYLLVYYRDSYRL